MKKIMLFATTLFLFGCEDTYRYPCQDPVNKDKSECNRPDCEADGFCYDTLNGLPPQQSVVEHTPVEEASAVTPAEVHVEVEIESTGE